VYLKLCVCTCLGMCTIVDVRLPLHLCVCVYLRAYLLSSVVVMFSACVFFLLLTGPCIDISRKRAAHAELPPRILVFQASPSAPSQYITLMNCIFSAQQLNVPIDVCLLTERDASPVLQQACDMTSGVFVHPENPQSLLPYLSVCMCGVCVCVCVYVCVCVCAVCVSVHRCV
jgi:Transcription factor Tfb4